MGNAIKIKEQKGIVLIAGLIFLVILTIIGISAMGSTALAERMAQNLRDISLAFEASEAALADGETWIKNQASSPTITTACTTPPCRVWQYNALGSFYQQPSSWWQANATPFSATLSGVAQQPRYIIEQYGFVAYDLSPETMSKGRGYYYYQITARGTGATTTANAVVQSIYAVQFN